MIVTEACEVSSFTPQQATNPSPLKTRASLRQKADQRSVATNTPPAWKEHDSAKVHQAPVPLRLRHSCPGEKHRLGPSSLIAG
ncbi:hypothetical protein E2C01_090070 [Portunus trituberculatus]|uniref:Uncharacterized protein n=1 Tax=Portunus trituberculatus TaxID=210409 RepID=A0A5B7JAH2_PORTR|nr:hypothetical protein [Portunus trituberculatus]